MRKDQVERYYQQKTEMRKMQLMATQKKAQVHKNKVEQYYQRRAEIRKMRLMIAFEEEKAAAEEERLRPKRAQYKKVKSANRFNKRNYHTQADNPKAQTVIRFIKKSKNKNEQLIG